MNPTNGPPDQDPRPLDERLREMGLQLVLRLLALIRIGRSYDVENRAFRTQVDGLAHTLAPIFRESNEVVLVALENDLYLNGVRIPMRDSNLRHHQAMLAEFNRRKIAGLKFEGGVETREIELFFGLFMHPDDYEGSALLEAAIANGCDRIQPAIYASALTPDLEDIQFVPSVRPGTENEAPGRAGDSPHDQGGAAAGGESTAHGAGRGVTSKTYGRALQGARSLLTTTALHDGIQMRHAKRVVQPLVDGAFASEPAVVGLAALGARDEFTYVHAVNVCMVSVSMGHVLGLDRRALADLGVASLLHDVGKAEVAARIRHPLEAFEPEEREAAESHPALGARLIADSTTLNPTTLLCMRVALEHHMTAGFGYPAIPDWTPSVLSQIVSVADCYVSLITHRSARGRGVTPYEALGMVLGPLGPRFDPTLLWALVEILGFYPPGQMVVLEDGAIALVLAPNAADLARPHVRIVVDSDGQPLPAVPAHELRPLPAERSVQRALKAEEYPAPIETRRAA